MRVGVVVQTAELKLIIITKSPCGEQAVNQFGTKFEIIWFRSCTSGLGGVVGERRVTASASNNMSRGATALTLLLAVLSGHEHPQSRFKRDE